MEDVTATDITLIADDPLKSMETLEDDLDQAEEVIPETAYDITSYGMDLDVKGIVGRLRAQEIIIPSFYPQYHADENDQDIPGFQRQFVWTRPKMDKFIESLLLGLPVPGIFLVRQPNNKLLVLDGQQRLQTLHDYYDGVHAGQEYRLRQVQERYTGCTYDRLQPDDRRQLDLSIIHATILRQESPDGNQDAIYSIFERLNTGGSVLREQEIRVALYHGALLDAIADTSQNQAWRQVYGTTPNRFKDHELILRVLAFYSALDDYKNPLKTFLNHYLEEHRNDQSAIGTLDLFKQGIAAVRDALGKSAFRRERALNVAVLDSVMVGIMRRMANDSASIPDLAQRYENLMQDQNYHKFVTAATNHPSAVMGRMKLATEAFR